MTGTESGTARMRSERRLAAAAEAVRQHEMATDQLGMLRKREHRVKQEVADLRAAHAAEQEDVEKLEGVSLARLVATLRGDHEDRLARERAEAETAGHLAARARNDSTRSAGSAWRWKRG